jgi:hypothetical protein
MLLLGLELLVDGLTLLSTPVAVAAIAVVALALSSSISSSSSSSSLSNSCSNGKLTPAAHLELGLCKNRCYTCELSLL